MGDSQGLLIAYSTLLSYHKLRLGPWWPARTRTCRPDTRTRPRFEQPRETWTVGHDTADASGREADPQTLLGNSLRHHAGGVVVYRSSSHLAGRPFDHAR